MMKFVLPLLCSFCTLAFAVLLVTVFEVPQDRAMSILQAMGVTAIGAVGWHIGSALNGEG